MPPQRTAAVASAQRDARPGRGADPMRACAHHIVGQPHTAVAAAGRLRFSRSRFLQHLEQVAEFQRGGGAALLLGQPVTHGTMETKANFKHRQDKKNAHTAALAPTGRTRAQSREQAGTQAVLCNEAQQAADQQAQQRKHDREQRERRNQTQQPNAEPCPIRPKVHLCAASCSKCCA